MHVRHATVCYAFKSNLCMKEFVPYACNGVSCMEDCISCACQVHKNVNVECVQCARMCHTCKIISGILECHACKCVSGM